MIGREVSRNFGGVSVSDQRELGNLFLFMSVLLEYELT